ncbi:CPXCG motif-containing cysteine-rich protein [Gemmatimonas sp.]|uniref:CPXCG motif-containing cysteine-rich protein n=1 Tax=Gemmatimonas sp. TaxID=1962908 RepID=UPI0033415D34
MHCPYCGESVEIALDPGSGANQQYIEDCQVCCRPWLVSVSYDEDGTAHVFVDASDDHDSDD